MKVISFATAIAAVLSMEQLMVTAFTLKWVDLPTNNQKAVKSWVAGKKDQTAVFCVDSVPKHSDKFQLKLNKHIKLDAKFTPWEGKEMLQAVDQNAVDPKNNGDKNIIRSAEQLNFDRGVEGTSKASKSKKNHKKHNPKCWTAKFDVPESLEDGSDFIVHLFAGKKEVGSSPAIQIVTSENPSDKASEQPDTDAARWQLLQRAMESEEPAKAESNPKPVAPKKKKPAVHHSQNSGYRKASNRYNPYGTYPSENPYVSNPYANNPYASNPYARQYASTNYPQNAYSNYY